MSTNSPRLDRIELLLEQIAQQQQRTQLQIDANTRAIAANSEEIPIGFAETRQMMYDTISDVAQIVNALAELQQRSEEQLQLLITEANEDRQMDISAHESFLQESRHQRLANTELFKQFATQFKALILEEREERRLNAQKHEFAAQCHREFADQIQALALTRRKNNSAAE